MVKSCSRQGLCPFSAFPRQERAEDSKDNKEAGFIAKLPGSGGEPSSSVNWGHCGHRGVYKSESPTTRELVTPTTLVVSTRF